jgi:hypothetical protein
MDDWFQRRPTAVCMMCETERATTFRDLWLEQPLPTEDLHVLTPMCAECLRWTLGVPIPNWPGLDPRRQ